MEVQNRALQAAYRLAQAVGSELKLEPLCDLIVEHLDEVFSPSAIHLLFLDAKAGRLYIKRTLGERHLGPRGLRVRAGQGVAGMALELREAIHLMERPDEAPVEGAFLEPFLAPVVAQPLLADRQVKGMLVLRWPEGARHPDKGDRHTLGVLARQVALYLDNAWLYGEVARLNEGLERQVEQRTIELYARNDELTVALAELKSTQAQLVQNAKMSSLGQLTAGIAHEINNPLAYSVSNIAMATERLEQVRQRVELLEAIAGDAPEDEVAEAKLEAIIDRLARDERYAEDVAALLAERETMRATSDQRGLIVAFLRYVVARERQASGGSTGERLEGMDRLLRQSHTGLERMKEIVLVLRRFSHLDEAQQQAADLDEGIRTTLTLVEHGARERGVRLEHQAGLEGPYSCYPAMLNQVVMNLVTNAVQASSTGGEVRVTTRETEEGPRVQVSDQGSGIAEQHLDRIFDPFFTTKPVGQGTGLGLSLSYKIVAQHGGQISVRSSVGEGTTFTVELPPRKKDT